MIDSAADQNNLILSNFNDYLIEGDGTLFVPRFKKLYVEGLTLNELTLYLTKNTKKFFLILM